MYEFFINYYKNYSFIAGLRTYNDDDYKQAIPGIIGDPILIPKKRSRRRSKSSSTPTPKK
jgi:hypothetical protein